MLSEHTLTQSIALLLTNELDGLAKDLRNTEEPKESFEARLCGAGTFAPTSAGLILPSIGLTVNSPAAICPWTQRYLPSRCLTLLTPCLSAICLAAWLSARVRTVIEQLMTKARILFKNKPSHAPDTKEFNTKF